jgi:hypothetical protein
VDRQEKNSGTFRLKMNLMVQNLLLSAFGTCKFVMHHPDHPVTRAIKQFKLIDPEQLDEFLGKIKICKPGQTMLLSIQDELLIYTALDITSKAYLTDLGDEMERLNTRQLATANSSFSEIRNTVLKGCQFVMEGMRERLSGNDEFEDRTDILDNYILAE